MFERKRIINKKADLRYESNPYFEKETVFNLIDDGEEKKESYFDFRQNKAIIAIFIVTIIVIIWYFVQLRATINDEFTKYNNKKYNEYNSKSLIVGKYNINFIEMGEKYSKEPLILLLHGRHYSKEKWVDFGIIGNLSKKHHCIAVDLPSFGESKLIKEEEKTTEEEQEIYFEEMIHLFSQNGKQPVVIVAPSYSGMWAFRMLTNYFSGKIGRKINVVGFCGIGLMGINKYFYDMSKYDIPTLLIWGEMDEIVNKENGEMMRMNVKNSQLFVFPNSNHSCHFENPTLFIQRFEKWFKTID